MKRTLLIVIAIAILLGAITAYAVTTWVTLPTDGTIKTPPYITANPTSIHWGQFDKNRNSTWNTSNKTFTLTNTGQQAAPLYLEYDNDPIIQSLSSNLTDGEQLQPGTSRSYHVELTIDPTTALTSFNFNIYITDG